MKPSCVSSEILLLFFPDPSSVVFSACNALEQMKIRRRAKSEFSLAVGVELKRLHVCFITLSLCS